MHAFIIHISHLDSVFETRVLVDRVLNCLNMSQTLVFEIIFIHTHYLFTLQDIKSTLFRIFKAQ